jgi:undecaprenyl pyrophosphate phosphatase UppP
LLAILAGGVSAFAVGLAALHMVVRLVRGGRLWMFAPYVALMGAFSAIFL